MSQEQKDAALMFYQYFDTMDESGNANFKLSREEMTAGLLDIA